MGKLTNYAIIKLKREKRFINCMMHNKQLKEEVRINKIYCNKLLQLLKYRYKKIDLKTYFRVGIV